MESRMSDGSPSGQAKDPIQYLLGNTSVGRIENDGEGYDALIRMHVGDSEAYLYVKGQRNRHKPAKCYPYIHERMLIKGCCCHIIHITVVECAVVSLESSASGLAPRAFRLSKGSYQIKAGRAHTTTTVAWHVRTISSVPLESLHVGSTISRSKSGPLDIAAR